MRERGVPDGHDDAIVRPVSDGLLGSFERCVADRPHATAIVAGAAEVSYAELDARSSRLAELLVGLGAGAERLVGVALPRSVDLVVAVLAVVKSGAAYLPLDPEHPAERLAVVLDDARPVVLLKILVAHRGRSVPRSRLVELLWPNEPAAGSGHRLSVLLSITRRVLDPDRTGPLAVDRFAVSLDVAVVDVDLERFLTTAAEAVEAHRQARHDAPTLLAAAESLYTGEFLPDDRSVDWAQDLRDEVELAYVGVLRAIADTTQDVDQRTNSLRRILRRDPYDEQAHVELVRGLHLAGRHGEAHRRYQAYVRGMREIGVPPVPEGLCGDRRLEPVAR